MRFKYTFTAIVAALITTSSLTAQEPIPPAPVTVGALSANQIEGALQRGARQKGGFTGLRLEDSGRKWGNIMSAAANGMNGIAANPDSQGFSLDIYTPVTWIEQLASNAAKEYRILTVNDLQPEDNESVVRVIVHPDTPLVLNAQGTRYSQSVQHTVLRDEKKTKVVQPIVKESFSTTIASSFRDMAYSGITVLFPLDALASLRQVGKGEFLVVVVGQNGERTFKIKQKHFERLPVTSRDAVTGGSK
jgi:hypothetical protein